MSHPRPVICQGELQKTFKVGNTIKLSKPELSKWTITAIAEEDDHPRHQCDGVPARTSARLTCEEVGNSGKRAFIRVCVQIPYVGTEFDDEETRRRQAAQYEPEELIALRKLSKCEHRVTPTFLGWHKDQQEDKWPVPGGFLLYYAWGVVDGVRLGDVTGNSPTFWSFERHERDLIRAALQETHRQCRRKGVRPTDASSYNLVWIPDQHELLWVDCREWGLNVKLKTWTDYLFASFDFAKAPLGDREWARWNGDTSDWAW